MSLPSDLPPQENSDTQWMLSALKLAQKAATIDEVPVGAIVVHNDQVIGSGHNQMISENNPCGHAEIIALRNAANTVNNYRLTGATLYVTLEPCLMCVGALTHARIKRLVFGCPEPKAGAIISQLQYDTLTFLNHRFQWQFGVAADTSRALLQTFFQQKRLAQ